jgi:hypothetical protein
MAEMHRKVIDYHQFVLENLQPEGQERARIVGYILREEKALADIGQLAELMNVSSSDTPIDHAALESAIKDVA